MQSFACGGPLPDSGWMSRRTLPQERSDGLEPGERSRVVQSIEDGIEDFERGDHMDGFDFIAQMRDWTAVSIRSRRSPMD